MAQQILLVGLGGCIGSVARYLVATWVQSRSGSLFPFGTLAVNVLGCLAIGALMALAVERESLSPNLRLLLVTGVLGGFTTFSAFGYETLALVEIERRPLLALANVAVEVVAGLAAAWAGWWVVSEW
jgi:CrcB protein